MRRRPRCCRHAPGLAALAAALSITACGDDRAPPSEHAIESAAGLYAVGGTVRGLDGEDLVLRNRNGDETRIAADGRFWFERAMIDGAAYEVTVANQPRDRSQTCVVTNGIGSVHGAVVEDVIIDCTTNRFVVGGAVRGLRGDGLVLRNGDGDTVAMSADGRFTFPTPLLDGSSYAITVATQPTSPAQTCTVVGGEGQLDDHDTTGIEVRCVGDHLRITEVGACYYNDGSCWFEVHNDGPGPEELSTYTLRANAALRVDPWTAFPARAFALPSHVIEPGGYALVRGRTTPDSIDGPQVVHVSDGDQVPYWMGDGFVELVFDGMTADFVRWGADPNAPITASAWSGPAVTALPSSPTDYGNVIARGLALADTDTALDWAHRAFATPAGPNDVTSDSDDDADGIPDEAEVPGGHYAGLDLYAMGARTGRRDLFLEIDRMTSSDPGLTPRREALDRVTAAFAAHDIALHVDAGDLFSATFDAANYNLGGGTAVPYAPSITLWSEGDGRPSLYDYKAAHFDIRRATIAHYVLFGSSQNPDGSGGSSGYAEIVGNDVLITLGAWGLTTDTDKSTNTLINFQAATIMHELGHNLGLRHGGDVDENYKPNYVSVMNYMYQLMGLPVIGGKEGDRYYLARLWWGDTASGDRCAAVSGIDASSKLERGPQISPTEFVIDYSDGSRAPLDERAIDEAKGLGAAGSSAVDYDCDGQIKATTVFDTNGGLNGPEDGVGTTQLTDHDDWSTLVFVFARQWGGISLLPGPVTKRVSPLVNDRQPAVQEDAPPALLLSSLHAS